MIGFPGETEDDFQKTIALANHLQIQLNTVIPFSSRPDTKANERTDKVPVEIIQNRCERLEEVLLNNKLNKFKQLATNITTKKKNEMLELIAKTEQTNLKYLNG